VTFFANHINTVFRLWVMVKIVVFGDSIGWGAFDDENGGWVERLKAHYFKTPEDWICVYNFSVSSNDTKGVLNFLEHDITKLLSIESDDLLFIFSIGSNDCRYIGSKDNVVVPLDEFKQNLRAIASIAKRYSTKIFFTGLMHVLEEKTHPWNENEYYENEDIRIYDSAIQQFCEAEKLSFIPLFDIITDEDIPDGIHPNAEGHRKIFRRVQEMIQSSLD